MRFSRSSVRTNFLAVLLVTIATSFADPIPCDKENVTFPEWTPTNFTWRYNLKGETIWFTKMYFGEFVVAADVDPDREIEVTEPDFQYRYFLNWVTRNETSYRLENVSRDDAGVYERYMYTNTGTIFCKEWYVTVTADLRSRTKEKIASSVRTAILSPDTTESRHRLQESDDANDFLLPSNDLEESVSGSSRPHSKLKTGSGASSVTSSPDISRSIAKNGLQREHADYLGLSAVKWGVSAIIPVAFIILGLVGLVYYRKNTRRSLNRTQRDLKENLFPGRNHNEVCGKREEFEEMIPLERTAAA